MVEFEKKVLLDVREYEYLKSLLLDAGEYFVQTNYYYDTDDYTYNKCGITCRIREKKGKYTATIKSHQFGEQERSLERSLSVKTAQDTTLFKGMKVRYQGSLETRRIVSCLAPGVWAMLDQNTYLDTIDYELEIEYIAPEADGAKRAIEKLSLALFSAGIIGSGDELTKRTKSHNKSERFFNRKKENLEVCL